MNSDFEEILKTEIDSKNKIQKAQEQAEKIKQEGINKAEEILSSLKEEGETYRRQKESGLKQKVSGIKKELEEKHKKDLRNLDNLFQGKREYLKFLISKLIGLK